jgi:hypothetical protein
MTKSEAQKVIEDIAIKIYELDVNEHAYSSKSTPSTDSLLEFQEQFDEAGAVLGFGEAEWAFAHAYHGR